MRFLLRRIGFFLVTLWAALTINFIIPRLMPGSPATAMMARFRGRVSGQAIAALEAQFGVNSHESTLSQYMQYLGNTLTGHFGVSLTYFPESVSHVVVSALPWTLGLVGLTTVLAFLAGTLIGTVSAWRRGGWLDGLLPPVFVITSAFPYFWVGLIALLLFSVRLGWLPLSGGYENGIPIAPTSQFIGSVLRHGLLPAVTLLVTSIGGWVLTMRNNTITTLAEDYVRMARAKGLSARRVMFAYAARNAILPNLTGFAMSLGFVVSGAILVEYVFSYPGLGYMMITAVTNDDYPLIQALFLLITVGVLVAVLLADILTAIMDPRTRDQR